MKKGPVKLIIALIICTNTVKNKQVTKPEKAMTTKNKNTEKICIFDKLNKKIKKSIVYTL